MVDSQKGFAPTPYSYLTDSTVVFIGKVEKVTDNNKFFPFIEATFRVTDGYKGTTKGAVVKIKTGRGGGDCGVEYLAESESGSTWLVFARKISTRHLLFFRKRYLVSMIVDPTSPLETADKEILEFLKKQ